jgi:selenide,water dikinase
VVRPDGAARSLVLTMDVITPIVDDPWAFGAIAATNALSDVYAMGGKPELALSFLGCPTDVVGVDVAQAILDGVHQVCGRARCAIVGGHTMKDTEPKCGLSVVGSVEPDRIWSQRFAAPGDALVITKAIGTGLVGQAVRKGSATAAAVEAAVARMTQLNDVACELGRRFGVHACTDVTGFGLLGHLRNMVDASMVTATLHASRVPELANAIAIAQGGCVPGGTRKNLEYALAVTRFAEGIAEEKRLWLADAQTSGGLLMSLPPGPAAELQRALIDAGIGDAAIVGEIGQRGEPRIVVEE